MLIHSFKTNRRWREFLARLRQHLTHLRIFMYRIIGMGWVVSAIREANVGLLWELVIGVRLEWKLRYVLFVGGLWDMARPVG